VKEINGHIESNHWRKLIECEDVPVDIEVLPSVWSMRRKQNLTTNEITKHKARLNLHGGKQVFGMNYFETCAPQSTSPWLKDKLTLFKLLLKPLSKLICKWTCLKALRHNLGTTRIMFSSCCYPNIYGQKQVGHVWNGYLVEKCQDIGFEQSLIAMSVCSTVVKSFHCVC
jgi:hypothetical protein